MLMQLRDVEPVAKTFNTVQNMALQCPTNDVFNNFVRQLADQFQELGSVRTKVSAELQASFLSVDAYFMHLLEGIVKVYDVEGSLKQADLKFVCDQPISAIFTSVEGEFGKVRQGDVQGGPVLDDIH